jgi:hypothetical protein
MGQPDYDSLPSNQKPLLAYAEGGGCMVGLVFALRQFIVSHPDL